MEKKQSNNKAMIIGTVAIVVVLVIIIGGRIVLPKDEKDRTRFIDLSKYEEYELAYIAGALQDNFRNDSYSEIHVLSDRYSVHKLQDFLGQISVNTMSPEGADIFGCITIVYQKVDLWMMDWTSVMIIKK